SGANAEDPARSLGQGAGSTGRDRLPRRSRQDGHSAGLPRRYRWSTAQARCCLRSAALPPERRRDAVAKALRHTLRTATVKWVCRPARRVGLVLAGGPEWGGGGTAHRGIWVGQEFSGRGDRPSDDVPRMGLTAGETRVARQVTGHGTVAAGPGCGPFRVGA